MGGMVFSHTFTHKKFTISHKIYNRLTLLSDCLKKYINSPLKKGACLILYVDKHRMHSFANLINLYIIQDRALKKNQMFKLRTVVIVRWEKS